MKAYTVESIVTTADLVDQEATELLESLSQSSDKTKKAVKVLTNRIVKRTRDIRELADELRLLYKQVSAYTD